MPTQAAAITQVINSITKEEQALGNLITKETAKLDNVLQNPDTTPADLIAINKSIGDMIAEIGNNNDALADKLGAALSGEEPTDPTEIQEREDAINDLIGSIADEEDAMADLIDKEAEKIQWTIDNPNSSIQDLIDINNSVVDVIKGLANNNTALAKKLATVTGN